MGTVPSAAAVSCLEKEAVDNGFDRELSFQRFRGSRVVDHFGLAAHEASLGGRCRKRQRPQLWSPWWRSVDWTGESDADGARTSGGAV